MEQGEGQGCWLDGHRRAGEQAEECGGPDGIFSDRQQEERGGGKKADAHDEVALAAFSEAVASVDQDEEGGGEEGGEK